MSWLSPFFDSEPVRSKRLFEGLITVKGRNQGRDKISRMIFRPGGPTWMPDCKRWVHARILGR
jgi:hypothetical protein